MMSFSYSCIVFSFFLSGVLCYDFKYADIAYNGLAFPNNIVTAHGHDLRIQLLKVVSNQESCTLKLPDLTKHNLKTKSEKFEIWGDNCGVKIKNISKSDEGMWRLISGNNNGNLEGIFAINVKDVKIDIPDSIDVNVFNDTKPTTIEISKFNTSYCYLSQKGTLETVMVLGKCLLELEKVNQGHEGVWNVNFGIPGLLEEEIDQSHLNVHVEEVIAGHTIKNDNTAHLYCNLRGSERHLKFCRFERANDGKAFNLVDGLGKTRYSYYGKGFFHNECGLTIENLQIEDYGSWKCTVGFFNGEESPFVVNRAMILHKPTSRYVQSTGQIIGIDGKGLKITCNSGVTISYCALTHPNGTEFPPAFTKDVKPDAEYWYSPEGLDVGKCEMNLKKATLEDNGIWVCNMGNQLSPGVELIDKIEVRVGGELASEKPIIPIKIGKPATLRCISAGGIFPLKYCRFITPSTVAFNIDSSVTFENALLKQYYYPEDHSIAQGDCIVTIKATTTEHLGEWKCAAMIDGYEYSDSILVKMDGGENLSTASVAGIVIGLMVLLAVISVIGLMAWKRGKFGSNRLQESRSTSGRPTVESQVHYTGRASGESDTSDTQFAITGQHSTSYSPAASSSKS